MHVRLKFVNPQCAVCHRIQSGKASQPLHLSMLPTTHCSNPNISSFRSVHITVRQGHKAMFLPMNNVLHALQNQTRHPPVCAYSPVPANPKAKIPTYRDQNISKIICQLFNSDQCLFISSLFVYCHKGMKNKV